MAALVHADERLKKEFPLVTLPVLICIGSADRATKPGGSQEFYEHAGSTGQDAEDLRRPLPRHAQRYRQGGSDGGYPGVDRSRACGEKFMKRRHLPKVQPAAATDRPVVTPTDLKAAATRDIAGAMNGILADVYAMYIKTKNFHWHMSGPHFRDYHLMLDEQATQLFAMTDPIAERIRKLGGTTLRSIGHIARLQRVADNDADYVDAQDMLAELREDNKTLGMRLRQTHTVCEEHAISRPLA